MKSKLCAAAAALCTLVAVPASSNASPVPHADSDSGAVVDKTPWVTVIQDPCTGELVFLTGEVQGVHRLAYDEAGVLLHQVEVNVLHVEGVGATSGTHYQMNYPTPLTNNFVGAREATAVSQFVLIATGPSNNARLFFIGHFTFDANGDETAAVFHEDSAICTRG